MKSVAAIKTYFEADGGPKVTMEEMKALTGVERRELGKLACEAMGIPFEE
jgi:hypothetical protein